MFKNFKDNRSFVNESALDNFKGFELPSDVITVKECKEVTMVENSRIYHLVLSNGGKVSFTFNWDGSKVTELVKINIDTKKLKLVYEDMHGNVFGMRHLDVQISSLCYENKPFEVIKVALEYFNQNKHI